MKLPYRYNELAIKYLIQQHLGAEAQDAADYRHMAAEIEKFSTDPQLEEIFRGVLQKAAEKVRAIAAQEDEHRKTLEELYSSLGLKRASPAQEPSTSPGLKGTPVPHRQGPF